MLHNPFAKRTIALPTSPYVEKGWFLLPLKRIARPSVVIGEGGSGKTETLLKIAYLAATAYGFDILYVDAKGDDDLAPRFVATMRKAGKQRIRLFPTTPYNGWAGDTRALHNRLMVIQTYSEPYYENMASMMLDLALNAPGSTPRRSTELLRNLTLEHLKVCYRGLPEQSELARIKPDDANGVYNRYRAFFRALHGKLDSGFTFDETDDASLADAEAYIEQEAHGNDAVPQALTPSQEQETPPTATGNENQTNATQDHDDQQQNGTSEPDLL